MNEKKTSGSVLIFIGVLGLIIIFALTYIFLFTSAFCGTAPHGCDEVLASFWRFLVQALMFCILFVFFIVMGTKLMK